MSSTRPIREHAARAKTSQYDDATGVWMIPVSDAWLDLLSEDWSPPVRLRAEQTRAGDWKIRVRAESVGDGSR